MPDHGRWEQARLAWNRAVDQRPAAVVLAEGVGDVVAAVRLAREHGLRVAPQTTGHGAAALGDLAGTLMVKTAAMRGVQIDPTKRLARSDAGALWMDVVQPAASHGLAALAGSSAGVGVAGYTLGGGIGWLGRRHGLAANSVRAVEIVTADGELVRADADHDCDLFWALRGGGGGLGVVTAIEFDLLPIAEVFAGAMFWPLESAADVLQTWRELTETAPEELTSVGRIMSLPPLPEIPEPLRGRSFAIVEAAWLGDGDACAELLAPLRALDPEIDTFATIPAPALSRLHMDPDGPVPGAGDGMVLDAVPAAAIDALIEVAGAGSGSPLLSVELRHLGGALGRCPADAGALAAIDGAFALWAVGIAIDEPARLAVDDHVDAVKDALAGFRASTGYLNFCDRPGSCEQFFSQMTYWRLCSVKSRYDGENMFRAAHPVAPPA